MTYVYRRNSLWFVVPCNCFLISRVSGFGFCSHPSICLTGWKTAPAISPSVDRGEEKKLLRSGEGRIILFLELVDLLQGIFQLSLDNPHISCSSLSVDLILLLTIYNSHTSGCFTGWKTALFYRENVKTEKYKKIIKK